MSNAPVPGVYNPDQLPGEVAAALAVLVERRDWLTARIAAKRSVGWDVEYDTRERDALTVVLEQMQP